MANKPPGALKHGGYSGLALLPGEDPTALEKLRADLKAEFAPVGALEEDIVETIVRLTWRKRNMGTYHLAQQASKRWSEIQSKRYASSTYPGLGIDAKKAKAMLHADKRKGKRELGPAWELVEMQELATVSHLLGELSITDRLDGMIDRCIKRLLLARGAKSILGSTAAVCVPEIKQVEAV